MTYLGLQISNRQAKVFSLNYSPLLKKTEEELNRWMDILLSLIGQINCIKMNILPKFLCLFQILPRSVPTYFLKQLNSSVSKFTWRKKSSRTKLTVLQGEPQDGGLKLHNFQTFYWAAWARQADLQHPPSWLQLEQYALNSMPFALIPYLPLFKQIQTHKIHL